MASLLARIAGKVVGHMAPLVLGRHPNNRVFSFNYFNVRHIRRYLGARSTDLLGSDSVILDVGGGASPYRSMFEGRYRRYISIDVPASMPAERPDGVEYVAGL